MSTDPTSNLARQRRRRHMRERQAVTFGVMLGVMAVSAFGAAAVYTGSLDLPFLSQEISSPDPTGLAAADSPCPPADAVPVTYSDITVNVYNGTTRSGLANTVASSLSERGFLIGVQGNASDRGYSGDQEGTALIEFGAGGAANAYTIAAQFDSPFLVLDDREDSSVDVVIGEDYSALVAASDVVLTAGEPFPSPDGCIPMDDVTPVTQPESTADAAEAAEQDGAAEG